MHIFLNIEEKFIFRFAQSPLEVFVHVRSQFLDAIEPPSFCYVINNENISTNQNRV